MVRLERCYQKTGESAKNFADRFLEEAERAGRRTDSALLHQFIRRLLPDLRMEVTRQRPATMEQAIEFCNYWTGANTENGTEERTSSPKNRDDTPMFRRTDANTRRNPPPFARQLDNRSARPSPWQRPTNNYNNRPPFKYDRDTAPRNANYRPQGHTGNAYNGPQTRPTNAPTHNIDDLAKQMEKLQINLQQTNAAREAQQQEINRLRAALRRPAYPAEHISIMDTAWQQYDNYYEDEADYDEIMAKRPIPGSNTHCGMPHKRVAFTPANQTP